MPRHTQRVRRTTHVRVYSRGGHRIASRLIFPIRFTFLPHPLPEIVWLNRCPHDLGLSLSGSRLAFLSRPLFFPCSPPLSLVLDNTPMAP